MNGFEKGTDALEKAIAKLNKFEDGVNKNNYDDAKDLYKEITDNEDYFNAVVEDKDDRKELSKTIKDFKTEVEDYRGENEDTFVKEYVRQLEKLKVDGKEVYDLVEKEADINYSNLKAVEKLLKQIKNMMLLTV